MDLDDDVTPRRHIKFKVPRTDPAFSEHSRSLSPRGDCLEIGVDSSLTQHLSTVSHPRAKSGICHVVAPPPASSYTQDEKSLSALPLENVSGIARIPSLSAGISLSVTAFGQVFSDLDMQEGR